MMRMCAWCRTEMGRVEGSSRPDSEISHGICKDCSDKLQVRQPVAFRRYLDGIPAPIVVLDGEVVVGYLNATACEVLGTARDQAAGQRCGMVLECANARQPGGCGKTANCPRCAIRRSVLKTFETGEPQSLVPAVLHRGGPDHPAAVDILITTVKAENVVVLRVDRAAAVMD